ncbi:hypothetical protein NQ176_g10093 [Zarea fungicola]|uniref:Uncharacterized protein n=1 Tax=Zarea fungicola TaxID=93591 RepID=A0ACC1MIS0_9HYPO|nr:hypothetical protein NQ176_g10093 [Lecanicillium fungicola]
MSTVNIRDTAQWATLLSLQPSRPLLVHLNGDTTWLLQIPLPSGTTAIATSTSGSRRAHFNVLIDPWLQGPQSDVASWFSTQVHVVSPAVASLAELQNALKRVDEAVLKKKKHNPTLTSWPFRMSLQITATRPRCKNSRETRPSMPPTWPPT